MDSDILDVHDNPGPSDLKEMSSDETKVENDDNKAQEVNSADKTTFLEGKTENEKSESSCVAKAKLSKNRKKTDSSVQHVLRALNSLTTPEEKLAAMCQKYAHLFEETRKIQTTVKQFQKQLSAVVKEKDQVRSDLAKSILTRSRLENLCRELQRQNKEFKEESFQKIKEEEEKRKEVSAKFQSTLQEITELMKEDNDKTMKLRDDNIGMTTKLKSISEQYEMREQQIEKMAKQMGLESQLYEARLAKMEMEASAEKEILLREKQQLLVTLTEYQAKFQEYQNVELALRNQVSLYNSKYEEFEKSLTRSNNIFGSFKEEMENMSNKIVKLESETIAWKQRWELTQKALIEMAAEKQKSDQEIIVTAKQMSALQKLCRTLQTERTQLLAKLNMTDSSGVEKVEDQSISSYAEIAFATVAENNTTVTKTDVVKVEKKHKRNQKSKSKRNESKLSVVESDYTSDNNFSEKMSNMNLTSAPKLMNEKLSSTEQTELNTSPISSEPLENDPNSDVFHGNVTESVSSESGDISDSQYYELKTSTHNSKTKNSPRKKNKK